MLDLTHSSKTLLWALLQAVCWGGERSQTHFCLPEALSLEEGRRTLRPLLAKGNKCRCFAGRGWRARSASVGERVRVGFGTWVGGHQAEKGHDILDRGKSMSKGRWGEGWWSIGGRV